ncbi:restriction endonuclease subunit S [Rhodanobacter sp. BL-MT-08]
MSSFNELIAERCPQGVAFKALGDVCVIKTGPNINKQDIAKRPGPYPVINSGRHPLGYFDNFNTDNDPIGIASRGSVGLVTWTSGRFFRGNLNYSCTVKSAAQLDVRFLYHYLLRADAEIQALATHEGIPALNAGALKTLQVPVPPKKVQIEIVRILDTFTKLTAELTAELTARKKQYNYYRDQLLSFEEGDIEWKSLGDEEYFEVASGGTPSTGRPDYWDDGNVPWLKSESCNNEPVYSANKFITELGLKKSTAKLLQKETTLIALVGATIFKTAFLEFPAATNQNIASIKSKNAKVIIDKFVFYFLTKQYDKLKSDMRNYGMLNLSTLRQFKIPVPSLQEQARIVAILDKFDALTNSIGEGLPREIELRQKQYAYCRDLLLSFPKSEEVAA